MKFYMLTLFRMVMYSEHPFPEGFDFTEEIPVNRVKLQHSAVFSVGDEQATVLLVQ